MRNLTELADLCHNEIRLVGTLNEWYIESYGKNDTIVVKYVGVVECNHSYISVKGVTTNYNDTIKSFVQEFGNENVIGQKVFILGKLNSINGITVDYMALSKLEDSFTANVVGIPYEANKLLIVDNDYHQIVSHNYNLIDSEDIYKLQFELNPLTINKESVIINDGYPPMIVTDMIKQHSEFELDELVEQAIDEHNIYVEIMKQGR